MSIRLTFHNCQFWSCPRYHFNRDVGAYNHSWLFSDRGTVNSPSMPIRIPSQIAVDCKSVHYWQGRIQGRGPRPPGKGPLQEKAPFLGPKHWYSMKTFLILVMSRANFGLKSGPWRHKWGPKYQYAQLKDKIGGYIGVTGAKLPQFFGSATPHKKSWIRPWIEKGLVTDSQPTARTQPADPYWSDVDYESCKI